MGTELLDGLSRPPPVVHPDVLVPAGGAEQISIDGRHVHAVDGEAAVSLVLAGRHLVGCGAAGLADVDVKDRAVLAAGDDAVWVIGDEGELVGGAAVLGEAAGGGQGAVTV